ncbi:MAG TPA: hypothetical protein VF310_01700, partial [Vicinamibacteria bacterium]
PHRLRAATAERLEIDAGEPTGEPRRLRTRVAGVSAVEGRFEALALDAAAGTLRVTLPPSGGEARVTLADGRRLPLVGAGAVEVSLARERVGAPVR